jgi:hypothetical protein
MSTVPYLAFRPQCKAFEKLIKIRIQTVLNLGEVIFRPEVIETEKALGEYIDAGSLTAASATNA